MEQQVEDWGGEDVGVASQQQQSEEIRESFLPSQYMMPPQSTVRSVTRSWHTAPPTGAATSSWNTGKIFVYVVVGFALYLLTYIAVQYAKDVRLRDERSQKHNLKSHVEHSMALAGRVPRGYRSSAVEEVVDDEDYFSFSSGEEDTEGVVED